MKTKWKKKHFIILSVILPIFIFIISVWYIKFHGVNSYFHLNLVGKKTISVEVGTNYKDKGVKASYNNISLNKYIKTKGNVNKKVVGSYKIKYHVKYKMLKKQVIRTVNVVDTISPKINLTGESINIVVGNNYTEPGYQAIDNYDGDITGKVQSSNNIDINKIGQYEVNYNVVDSSNNKTTVKRLVNVVNKNSINQKIAVLNYHFFYDPNLGESCNDGNCKKVSDFKNELNYLKNNSFKTLTMKEFRDWMYGVTELPEKSVLITIDDGAMGTGIHNGNKVIPILEEYKMHATLFLITGWWDVNNYKSPYLDIESHTHDMHNEGWCKGVTRGARMLCQSNDEVLNDLKTSISITGSKLGFCFPFYAYDDNAINLVKQAGFDLAFIGGAAKTTRATDKWHIPRYQIKQNTTLETFINYVS